MSRNLNKITTFFTEGNRTLVFSLSFLLIFSLASYALAAARTTPFTPGETLDPGAESVEPCGPTDTNCYVSISTDIGSSIGSATAGSIFFAGTSGVLAQDNASLFFDNSSNELGIGTTSPLAKVHVGGRAVNNSSDAQILISRAVDDTVSGNGHAFSDSSLVTRAGTIGYNSFDSRIDVSGTENFDHFAGFQEGIKYASSGTVNDLYGFVSLTEINAGTVTRRYGVDIWDPTGAGTLTNNYGIHVQPLTKGTNNFAIYTAGTTKSYFGGNVGIGIAIPTEKLDVQGNSVVGRAQTSGSSAFTAVYDETGSAYVSLQKRGSSEAGYLAGSLGFSEILSVGSDLGIFTYNSNYLSFGTATTERMRITPTGTIGIGTGATVSAKLHVLATTEQLRVGYDASNYYTTTIGSSGGVTFDAVGSGSLFTFSDSVVISGANSINFDNAAGVNITGSAGVGSNVLIGTSNTAATSGVGRTIVGSVNTVNAAASYSTIVGRTNVLTSAESEVTILGNFNTLTDADSGHIILGGTNTTNFTGGSTSRGTFNIGYSNSVVHNFSSIIGSYQTTTATNQLIIADANDNNNSPEGAGYNDVYFGTGPRRSAAGVKGSNVTINGSGAASATATDVAGGHLTIAGGKGTGTGTSGDVYISTATVLGSGTTLQSLTQRLVVEGNTGDVGIGDLTPSYRLEVANDVAEYVANIFNDGNAATRSGLRIQAGLDDHTAAGPSTLIGFFDGDGGAVGSITFGSSATAYNTTSDQRLKTNIVDTALSLDLLNQIQIRDYTWIADSQNKLSHGVIAQELYAIYPEAVTRPIDESTGYWMVDYSKLTPVLVKAVQEIDFDFRNLDVENSRSLGSLVRRFLENATNGLRTLFADKVQTKELCIEDVCVNKTQLQFMLNQQGSVSGGNNSSNNTGGGESVPEEENGSSDNPGGSTENENTPSDNGGEESGGQIDEGGTTDGGDVVPEPEPTPTPEPEPTPTPEPEPTPTPEPEPTPQAPAE